VPVTRVSGCLSLIAAQNRVRAQPTPAYTANRKSAAAQSLPPWIDEQSHQIGITFGVHGRTIIWRDLCNPPNRCRTSNEP
jgi:hypothetical protein